MLIFKFTFLFEVFFRTFWLISEWNLRLLIGWKVWNIWYCENLFNLKNIQVFRFFCIFRILVRWWFNFVRKNIFLFNSFWCSILNRLYFWKINIKSRRSMIIFLWGCIWILLEKFLKLILLLFPFYWRPKINAIFRNSLIKYLCRRINIFIGRISFFYKFLIFFLETVHFCERFKIRFRVIIIKFIIIF